MRQLILGVCAFAVFHGAHAQSADSAGRQLGCAAGQAVQSLDLAGRSIACVPVPPPVDLGPVNAAIDNEAKARRDADTMLFGEISDLRAKVEETSIVGRWAFTGTQTCLSSSRNFNADFTPVMPPLAAPPPPPPPPLPGPIVTPPPPVVVPTTFVATGTVTVTGFRTFRADGTGTLELDFVSLNHPGVVFVNFGTPTSSASGVPGASSGTQTASFRWEILDGRLIIDDNDENAVGTLTSGGRAGWITVLRDLPKSVGVLGKDARTLTMSSLGPKVELSILRSPPGVTPAQEFVTPRVCQRDRVLRKLAVN